jgi:hypothetical protein
MHSVVHSIHAAVGDRVARFYGDLVNMKPLATELQHLRHEWKRVQLAVFIKCCKYFLGAHYFHEIADVKAPRSAKDGLLLHNRSPDDCR